MRKPERYRLLIDYFTQNFPEPETELHYTNAYELLVAVVLSAQCTDKRVNMVTPDLLKQFPTPEHLAEASSDEIFPYIKSISYPNNKAKHLAGLGKKLVENFNSEVPSTIEELQQLPGVGRKTANVIASVIYNQPAMAVDTHVFRVSKRLGLVSAKAKNSAGSRTGTGKIYPYRTGTESSPLADPARSLCLRCTPAEMRNLPFNYFLCLLSEKLAEYS